jgi:hypothetical protein
MNALLQHRGHNLMGAGRSIAVQNFNEQACILGLGAFYSLSAGMGLSAFGAITAFGVVVAGFMWLIQRWHASNLVKHKEEVDHLLASPAAINRMAGLTRCRSTRHPRAVLALILNAFVWGVSWWPFRQLQGHGLHPLWTTALVYAVVVAGLLALRPQAWRGFLAHPQLWCCWPRHRASPTSASTGP